MSILFSDIIVSDDLGHIYAKKHILRVILFRKVMLSLLCDIKKTNNNTISSPDIFESDVLGHIDTKISIL